MLVSQKCQYALRAMFELARRQGRGPVKIADIARAQDIPKRFLEVILGELKHAGFVTSQRGNEGGYLLARAPHEVTVGDVVRFVQGPIGPVKCIVGDAKPTCRLYRNCVFLPMWEKVGRAIAEVYDSTTFQHLVDQAAQSAAEYVPEYAI
ncbi:MAG: RrF2 family transcriptional regulator [Armatimonadota bacterium]